MKFTFDLFHGDKSPSPNFIKWVPNWWHYSAGFPIEKGVLPNGDEWLLAGWFLSGEELQHTIEQFLLTSDLETLFKTDGQFILAVYSKGNSSVAIYRDRTGILPFVYAQGENGLAISLWIQNVLDLTKIKPNASHALFEQWPVYRGIIPPDTTIKGLEALSGRCSLHIANGRIWQNEQPVLFARKEAYPTLRAASNELGKAFSQAVEKRLRGKSNVAVWLSGGNDSSLLVAQARKHYQGRMKTVFVTFEDYERNYGREALQVAKKYDAEHEEIELTIKDYVNLFAETINAIQAPINHPGTIGQTSSLKALSGAVDVIFTGKGADTVFGGPYWAPMLLLSYVGKILPTPLRNISIELSKQLKEETFLSRAMGKCLKALSTPFDEYLISGHSFGDRQSADLVFGSETWRGAINNWKSYIKEDPLTDLFFFDILDWHPVTYDAEKRLCFYYGLLPCYPFLDYELIKNSIRLPVHLRYHYRAKKAALKKYAEDFLDREFIYKPKEGFGVPLGKWFAKPEFAPFLNLPLEERSLRRGWWNEKELKIIIDLHKSAKGTDKTAESIPWITTNLELWARICLEGDSPSLYKIA